MYNACHSDITQINKKKLFFSLRYVPLNHGKLFFPLSDIMFMIYFLIFFIAVIVISTNEKVLAIKLELR